MSRKFVKPLPGENSGVSWLWTGRIPLGALTVLEGNPGDGKSAMICDLMVRVTRGRPFPFDESGLPYHGGAILLQKEGGIEIISADLERNQADLELIRLLDREMEFSLLEDDDLERLDALMMEIGCRLVVIDPIFEFLGGRAAAGPLIRRVLGRLRTLAERHQAAMLLVRHFAKSPFRNAVHRGAGALEMASVPRSILTIERHAIHSDVRILQQVKTNLGPISAPICFGFNTAKSAASHIDWLSTEPVTEADLRHCEKKGMAEWKAAVMIVNLMQNGMERGMEIKNAAISASIAEKTFERASVKLGIKKDKVGSRRGSYSRWSFRECQNDYLQKVRRFIIGESMIQFSHRSNGVC